MSDARRPRRHASAACRARSRSPTTRTVLLAHGGGGRLSADADRAHVRAARSPTPRSTRCTTARCSRCRRGRLAFTTDSFVVSPLFFPGGDIGSLAVHGTVNDLAMCGARPLALSAGFILEEGLPMEELWRIVQLDAGRGRARAGVPIVTGDTKVVDRGKGDGVFINTSGHRRRAARRVDIAPRARRGRRRGAGQRRRSPSTASPSCRCARGWSSRPRSRATRRRCTALVADDAGRGGDARARAARSDARRRGERAERDRAGGPGGHPPGRDARSRSTSRCAARARSSGLDPLYVANEGKCLAIVARGCARTRVLAAMRAHPLGREAAVIGEVVAEHPGGCSCAAASAARAWSTC